MEYDIRSFSQDPRGQKWTGWAGCGAIARASLDNNRDDAWADRQGVPLSFARRRSRFACVPRVITCTMSDRARNELAARLRAAEARVWSLWQAGHVARPQQHHTKEEWRIPGLRSLAFSRFIPQSSRSSLRILARSTCCDRQWRRCIIRLCHVPGVDKSKRRSRHVPITSLSFAFLYILCQDPVYLSLI